MTKWLSNSNVYPHLNPASEWGKKQIDSNRMRSCSNFWLMRRATRISAHVVKLCGNSRRIKLVCKPSLQKNYNSGKQGYGLLVENKRVTGMALGE
jgi:hypothetical protein